MRGRILAMPVTMAGPENKQINVAEDTEYEVSSPHGQLDRPSYVLHPVDRPLSKSQSVSQQLRHNIGSPSVGQTVYRQLEGDLFYTKHLPVYG